MKEHTRLELNISSLIWENCANQNTEQSQRTSLSSRRSASASGHLVLHVGIFERQRQRGDVLPVHPIAAPDLYGMLDAFVDLLRGGVPDVRQ